MLAKIILWLISLNIFIFPQITVTNSIVAGGVTSSSAKFFIRVSQEASINIEVSGEQTFASSIKGTAVNVTTGSDLAGIVNVEGLSPDTKYFYRVLINDAPAESSVRYFWTFPQEGAISNFTFAFGSCQQGGPGSQGNVYNEIVKHQPRFFLQIGDWGYPDTTDNLPFDSSFFSADYSNVQSSYEHKYDLSYPMDSLLRIAPVDYLFDDHDYMNNNASAATSSFSVPLKPNPLGNDFIVREITNPPGARENSIRGYKENFPGYPLVNESRGIYHKFSFGNAEFFMLDLRSQRSPDLEALVKNNSSHLWEFKPPAGHTILGRDNAPGSGENQLDWFLNSLLNSRADWKFIVSTVPFNKSQSLAIDLSIFLQDLILDIPSEDYPDSIRGIFAAMELSDKWAGFTSDIDTVLNFINANNIKNVIVLSGDSHTAAMDDGANSGLPEIMAGGLDITNSQLAAILAAFGLNIWNRGGQGLTTSDFNNAFGKISVFGSDSVRLSLIDEFGTDFANYTIANSVTGLDSNPRILPRNYELSQNYPNPFNPETLIEYSISQPGFVSIKLYDVLGCELKTLTSGFKGKGKYKINFNSIGFSSGVYFYAMKVNNFSEIKKMMILK
ncbi:MAG TPA: alkaline phosphatase D family protein [Ignavibacteriaceae bacterium]|nr:alkaline phosphatase D family protein [Ignavibacteriaceae bacterium]